MELAPWTLLWSGNQFRYTRGCRAFVVSSYSRPSYSYWAHGCSGDTIGLRAAFEQADLVLQNKGYQLQAWAWEPEVFLEKIFGFWGASTNPWHACNEHSLVFITLGPWVQSSDDIFTRDYLVWVIYNEEHDWYGALLGDKTTFFEDLGDAMEFIDSTLLEIGFMLFNEQHLYRPFQDQDRCPNQDIPQACNDRT